MRLSELFKEGNYYYKEKKYDKALSFYNEYLRKSGSDNIETGLILYNKGVILIKINNYNDAISCFKESLRIFNKEKASCERIGNAYFNLGCCYSRLGDNYRSYRTFYIAKKYIPDDIFVDRAMNITKNLIKIF